MSSEADLIKELNKAIDAGNCEVCKKIRNRLGYSTTFCEAYQLMGRCKHEKEASTPQL